MVPGVIFTAFSHMSNALPLQPSYLMRGVLGPRQSGGLSADAMALLSVPKWFTRPGSIKTKRLSTSLTIASISETHRHRFFSNYIYALSEATLRPLDRIKTTQFEKLPSERYYLGLNGRIYSRFTFFSEAIGVAKNGEQPEIYDMLSQIPSPWPQNLRRNGSFP